MWTSLGKSIGDFVEERLTSPLISSFGLAWAAVNYKFFVILFSKNPDGHPNSPVYGHLKLPHLN